MTRGLAIVLAALAAVAIWPAKASAKPKLSASLQRAIVAFNQGNDQLAQQELQRLLAEPQPPSVEAARAHLYLGLISLNRLQNDAARTQFTKALALDSTLELPIEASPKAQIPFHQARLAAQNLPADVPPAPKPDETLAAASAAAPEPAPHISYALPLVIGGAGLAGMAVGAVFLGLSAGALSSAKQPIADVNQLAAKQALAQTSANEQSAANFLLGIGGGVVAVAGAMLLVELLSADSPATSAPTKAMSLALEGMRF